MFLEVTTIPSKKQSIKKINRYLVMRIESESPVAPTNVMKALQDAFQSFFGMIGMAIHQPAFMGGTGTMAMVSVDHLGVSQCQTAASFIEKINDVRVRVSTIKVTGTMKHAKPLIQGKMEE